MNKKIWNGLLSRIDIEPIISLGFEARKDGFFRKFSIDLNALADAIKGRWIDDAFGPLRSALTDAERAGNKFDKLLSRAIKQSKKER